MDGSIILRRLVAILQTLSSPSEARRKTISFWAVAFRGGCCGGFQANRF
jgi:hypothetical protein